MDDFHRIPLQYPSLLTAEAAKTGEQAIAYTQQAIAYTQPNEPNNSESNNSDSDIVYSNKSNNSDSDIVYSNIVIRFGLKNLCAFTLSRSVRYLKKKTITATKNFRIFFTPPLNRQTDALIMNSPYFVVKAHRSPANCFLV